MATLHHVITKNFDAYVEGKNLTNSIVSSYLNVDRSRVWANGEATGQSASGVGAGYIAYGRSYAPGMAYRF